MLSQQHSMSILFLARQSRRYQGPDVASSALHATTVRNYLRSVQARLGVTQPTHRFPLMKIGRSSGRS